METYTPKDVAEKLKIDVSTARTLMLRQPGTIVLEGITALGSLRNRRRYRTVRIPVSVFQEMCARLAVK